MDDYQKYNQLICSLRQDITKTKDVVQSHIAAMQSVIRRLISIEDKVKAMDSEFGLATFDVEMQNPEAVAIADGEPLSAKKACDLQVEDFDVVFDLPLWRMWARHNPAAKSKLIECGIKRWRQRKCQLLAYMLKHPKIVIGLHNICQIYQHDKEVPANTLAQTMRSLRLTLHQTSADGSYIINTPVYERIGGIEEFIVNGYVINSKFHYLVILENFQNHQKFIDELIGKS